MLKSVKKSFSLFIVLAAFTLLVLLYLFFPDLNQKEKEQKNNRSVGVMVDGEEKLPDVLSLLDPSFVSYVALPMRTTKEEETKIRQAGFKIYWKDNGNEESLVPLMLNRLEQGDGIFSLGEYGFGYPGYVTEVSQSFKQKKSFLSLFEFTPQKGLSMLAQRTYPYVVKAHLLPMEQMMSAQPERWKNRLVRAVKERGVRLLAIHLSPALSLEQNQKFLMETAEELKRLGFRIEAPVPFSNWAYGQRTSLRQGLMLLVAILSPVVGLLLIQKSKSLSPFLTFLLVSGLALMAGVTLQAVGSIPQFVLGVVPVRGVKIQLCAPLLLSLFFLFTKEEWSVFLNSPIKVKHLVVGGGVLIGLGGLYLMRSGNFPLIPVSQSERGLRDIMEQLLGARPRFKEVLFGHPLLILGLTLRQSYKGEKNFFRDGRFWIWLGLIGQISILNTFAHIHSPLMSSVLRTFHGLWLGLLCSIPFCYLVPKIKISP